MSDPAGEFLELQQAMAGEYSLDRELGRGGMGIVYLAREVQLDRLVAIKVLRPELASRPDIRARFLREARLAASLSHPNIIQIFRVVDRPELTYISMQCIDGETLGERLRRRGPMKSQDAETMLREVAWALAHAHGRGLVHRDVKPDNILLERETGRAIVSDFGIATARADERASGLEPVMGSAHFMSREQGTGGAVDGRSDLYSLGVVGFLALSGRFPFDGATLGEVLAKQALKAAPSLATVAPSVPHHLALAIDRCLRTEPSERFATVDSFAEALRETGAVRRTLPPELQTWVDAQNPWKAFNAAVAVSCAYAALMTSPGDEGVFLAVGAVPLALAVLRRARLTEQLLGAGYTVADIRIGLRSFDADHRGESVGLRQESGRRWLSRVFRWTSWATIGSAVVAVLNLRFELGLWTATDSNSWVAISLLVAAMLSIVTAPALGVSLAPGLGSLSSRLRRIFWDSRMGEWVGRVLTPRQRVTATQFAHRPTEIALGLAVEELYRALPNAYRDNVRDLPAVVRRLEAHAQRARGQLATLNRGSGAGEPGGGGPDERSPTLDVAQRELRDAIGALEAIRLHLLRLHGGVENLQPVTTVLDAARRVGDDLDRLDQAQREVSKSPRPRGLDVRTPTPA
jgi:eukaryotic-like serine/threonine-protein kinase